MITNSASLRFDIYSGSFTKNDQLTVSPFVDSFLFIPDVPLSVASSVLSTLNRDGSQNRRSLEQREEDLYGLGYVERRYRRWLEEMDRRHGKERRATGNQTLGYVTHDVGPVSSVRSQWQH